MSYLGTGLTHLGSAKNRSAMHELKDHELTDSMRIFQWGLASGKPPAGTVGVPPEWFYKGNGTTLHAHDLWLMVFQHLHDRIRQWLVGVFEQKAHIPNVAVGQQILVRRHTGEPNSVLHLPVGFSDLVV